MVKGRLEAFSDGVFAVIITIMVLDLKVPHGSDMAALRPVIPVFLTYVLSFVFIAIYWNNHYHMLHAVRRVNGFILWANLHLLFWLSVVPFITGWMGENQLLAVPVALYGVVLFMSGLAYFILSHADCLAAPGFGAGGRRGAFVRAFLDFHRAVHFGGGHVVYSRPAHRTCDFGMKLGAVGQTLLSVLCNCCPA